MKPLAGRPIPRAVAAFALVSAWILSLFTGHVWGGAAHALLVAAVVVFPWGVARA